MVPLVRRENSWGRRSTRNTGMGDFAGLMSTLQCRIHQIPGGPSNPDRESEPASSWPGRVPNGAPKGPARWSARRGIGSLEELRQEEEPLCSSGTERMKQASRVHLRKSRAQNAGGVVPNDFLPSTSKSSAYSQWTSVTAAQRHAGDSTKKVDPTSLS